MSEAIAEIGHSMNQETEIRQENKAVAIAHAGLPAEAASEPSEYGSLAVSLARAEIDQQITTARAYPRSITRAVEHILSLATLDEKTADKCIYALPRGRDETGKKKIIRGPSIRLAEIAASQWGNCRIGSRVVHVDRFEKYIEAEGIFHDLETNTAWTSRVRRGIIDKNGGIFSADMIVVTGNAACAIAKRNSIFAGIPRGIWGKAYDAVEHILTGDVKTLVSRRRSAIATLTAEYSISEDQIFQALDILGEEDIDLQRLATLTAMRASLKNGEATVAELFPKPRAPLKTLNEKLDAIAHDPETGEIISDEMAELAQKAAEEQNGRVNQRAQIDAVAYQAADKAGMELAMQLDERDQHLQSLLDAGKTAALHGAAKFKQWEGRLNAPDFTLLEPHLAGLREQAEGAKK